MRWEVVKMARTVYAVLLAVGFATTPGCGDGRPKRFAVTGVVVYHGKPVAAAQVVFYPKGARPASGTTDAAGRFTLLTFAPDDGAVMGEHTVCVSKYLPDPTDKAAAPYQRRIAILPVEYGTPLKSPLRATVTAEGPNEFRFELVDSPR
jgi:hypothetical protein